MIGQDASLVEAVRSIDRLQACASCEGLSEREWEDSLQGVGKPAMINFHSCWALQNAKWCQSCAMVVARRILQAGH